MRKLIRMSLTGAVLASAGLTVIVAWPIGRSLEPLTLVGNVDQGAYLARASGCIACHTNFAQGGAPLAGGVALDTPFGTLFSPNLTTDPDHGIGGWSMAQFARAVRQGVSQLGIPIIRPSPIRFTRTSPIKILQTFGRRFKLFLPWRPRHKITRWPSRSISDGG